MNTNKTFNLYNSITGWFLFIISSVVYLLTKEPTASFWDCGEFISSAFKLEVGHPPGAPFFMLLGNFFSHFTNDPTKVASLINSMSALASGLTIMFLFWTITHLARKIFSKQEKWDLIAIIGSGIIGALAYAFSDTFWFSAVEGEVYATSSLFTAVVFWAILKWENEFGSKYANRWIIFIAYLMGLSIGVHLLNLLAIPAIVLVYYYKTKAFSWKGTLIALVLSIVALAGLMYVIIPIIPRFAAWFDLLFVNTFGLNYNSGALFYMFLLASALGFGLWYTLKKGKYLANTILLIFTVITIGYSSFALIIIRSSVNTPMNQNAPDNPFSLIYYLNREQYGDRPLVKGQYFNAPVVDRKKGSAVYIQKDGKYVISDYKSKLKYDPRFTTIFPRMWSSNENQHIEDYKEWTNYKGKAIKMQDYYGNQKTEYVPYFSDNLKYFFKYQVNFMYWRYFMWNFVGRQNDIQGHGDVLKGNWLSGINFIDKIRLGPQDNLPRKMKENKGRNTYYFLPFILGLVGLVYHYKKSKNEFLVVSILFIMTGLAIVVYLNQYPHQPRERDYAYAGSFYAFTIWIGLGLFYFIELLKKFLPQKLSVIISFLIWLFLVPGIMAVQNWDDHDRSDRFTARDFAKNYLNSCEENAILFTNGDNDTFPLWYAQEVEGIRTDVRVSNMSYLRADWYVDQMKKDAYESEALPISMTSDKYSGGNRDYALAYDQLKKPLDLKRAVDFVNDDNPKTQVNSPFEQGKKINYFPATTLVLPIDRNEIIRKNVVRAVDSNKIVSEINIKLTNQVITKEGMVLLDILANNEWNRPVYYAITVGSENYYNLDPYFQVEGLSYRIVPIKNEENDYGLNGRIATDIMFDNVINKFVWGGIDNLSVYLDENNIRMLTNYRSLFGRLANELILENKPDSAKMVLDRCISAIPEHAVPHNYYSILFLEGYYKISDFESAKSISESIYENAIDELEYYITLNSKQLQKIDLDVRINLAAIQEIYMLAAKFNQEELMMKYQLKLQEYFDKFRNI